MDFHMFKDSHHHIKHAEQNAREAIATHNPKLFETSMNQIKSFFSQGDSQQEAIESFETILAIMLPNYKNFLVEKHNDPDTLNKISLTRLFERNATNFQATTPGSETEAAAEIKAPTIDL